MTPQPAISLDFKEATYRIAYEMYHFRCYARMYRESTMGTGLYKQLFSQSLLLSLRLHLDFFYTPPRKLDVWVGHFRQLPEFEAAFPARLYEVPDDMQAVKDHISQRLVHFSSARWNGVHPPLEDYAELFDGIEERITAFDAALPEALRIIFAARTSQFIDRDKSK